MIEIVARQKMTQYWPALVLREQERYYKFFIRASSADLTAWQGHLGGPGASYVSDEIGFLTLEGVKEHDTPLTCGRFQGKEGEVIAQIEALISRVGSVEELIDLLRMNEAL